MKISMNLFRRGKIFYVRLDSKRRISLRTEDPREAQRLFNEIKRKWLAGKLALLENRCPEITLEQFSREYSEHSCRTKARNTWRADDLVLRKLIDHFGPTIRLSAIKRKEIDHWLANLKVSRTSANIYLRHLQAIFNQAVAWGYLKESPAKGIKQYRNQERLPRFLSQAEIRKLLLAETNPHFRNLWKFLLLTGCRRSEALQIQAKDINWQQRIITVHRTKTRAPKIIRITEEIAKILADLPKVGRLFPWTANAVTHHFKRTCTAAGLDYRLHDLRHTFASHLAMAGVDLYTIKELLGHREIKTTQIYSHLSQDHLDQAMAKINLTEE